MVKSENIRLVSGRNRGPHLVNVLCNRDPDLLVVPRLPITSDLLSYLLNRAGAILKRNRTFRVELKWNVRIPAPVDCVNGRVFLGNDIMLPR